MIKIGLPWGFIRLVKCPNIVNSNFVNPWIRAISSGLCIVLVSGCAHQKPRLYPNAAAQTRGPAVIDRDIESCENLAEAHGVDYSDGGIARRTAEGGVVGGASGAAVGAVVGNVGRGAAVGAAYGVTSGFFRGLFAGERPHPTYQKFVNRCLRDKGYDPVGWS